VAVRELAKQPFDPARDYIALDCESAEAAPAAQARRAG
jgi:hypothetical protein